MWRWILLGTLSASLASGDRIILRNGESLEGDYFGGTSQEIRFVVRGKLMFVNASEVAVIELGEVTGLIASEAAKAPGSPCPPCPDNCSKPVESVPGAGDEPESKASVRRPEPDAEIEAPQPTGPPPASFGEPVQLPSGTVLVVRLLDEVDAKRDRTGSRYRGVLARPVEVRAPGRADPVVAAPGGAEVILRLTSEDAEDDVRGSTKLGIEAVTLSYNGRRIDIRTYRGERKGRTTKDRVGEGLGRVGAAVGRALGGAAGREVGSTTEETIEEAWDKASRLEAGTELEFTLAQSVEVSWPERPDGSPPEQASKYLARHE